VSIQVKDISKLFGKQKALDNINFSVKSGEIVGFLGPNGAGKSTMMKIISCFLPPTQGSVKVCGYDVLEQSLEVRSRIGYLPEHNPLYLDMYIKEYLAYVCGIYKITDTQKQIVRLIELTGLGIEQHKKIGALSKGYRQRVGLAQALIHNPEVLILDEPTTGLDPNQIVDIRNLIKEIGKEKTVMLSTHIMQEVKAVCDRIIIINKGQIVADEKTEQIQKTTQNQQIIRVEFDKPISIQKLKTIAGVTKVNEIKPGNYQLYIQGNADARPLLFKLAVAEGLTILSQTVEEQSLEEVFRKLTR